MDSDSRLQALEEELKLLKAEVKSVLLDIREVVLSRSNPLRFDLPPPAEEPLAEAGDGYEAPALGEGPAPEEESAAAEPAEAAEPSGPPEPQPAASRGWSPGTPHLEPTAALWQSPPLSGGDFVAWLASSMRELGPQRLGHLLALYRLLKPVPANVNQALGHLQELLASSDGPEPYWLKALVELDRLAR